MEEVLCLRPVVEAIAREIKMRLPPWVSLDDLISAGWVGALDAYRRYDARRNDSLAGFARRRIRGEMFEDLRRTWHGCASAPEMPDERIRAPLESMIEREEKQMVRRALGALDARSRRILTAYFYGCERAGPIAAREGVRTARIYKLFQRAIGDMKTVMEGGAIPVRRVRPRPPRRDHSGSRGVHA